MQNLHFYLYTYIVNTYLVCSWFKENSDNAKYVKWKMKSSSTEGIKNFYVPILGTQNIHTLYYFFHEWAYATSTVLQLAFHTWSILDIFPCLHTNLPHSF